MSWAEVESMIKSCVVSKKGDMTLRDLKGEYYELVGQDIPFQSLGCESLEVFLSRIPGVYLSRNARGETIITAASQKTAHIANLVQKQKTDPKVLKKRGRITYATPKKHIWNARRNAPRHYQSINGNSSRTKTVSASAKWPKANGFSRFAAGRDHCSNSRLSSTQVRYIPAGEELSDDSYGSSQIGRERDESHTFSESEINIINQNDDCIEVKQEPDMSPPSNSPEVGIDNSLMGASYSSDANWTEGHYRTVTFTGETLRCVVSATPPPDADSSVFITDVEDSDICSSWDNGPVMLGYHLVGDDFLLQFAYECLHMDYDWDDSERLTCGMCISGQTIHDFHMQVQHEGVFQRKVILMLGSVDILQNRPLRCIIDDMTDLVEDIVCSGTESLLLLTLPYLKNAGLSNRKVVVFNEFLKTLDDGVQVQVLDVHPLFNSYYRGQTNESSMNLKCYEMSTRDVLCYPNGVVLWSHIGRSYLYNFLLQQLNEMLENKY